MSSIDFSCGNRGLVELKEAARIVNLSEPTFRSFLKRKPSGFPEALRPGKKYYFRVAELERWILGSAAETMPLQHPSANADATKPVEEVRRRRGRPRKGVLVAVEVQEATQ